MINETTDLDRWRLAFDGPTCVGSSIGSGASSRRVWVMGRSVSFGSTAGVASPDTCCWTPWPETLRRASREHHCLRRDEPHRRNSTVRALACAATTSTSPGGPLAGQ